VLDGEVSSAGTGKNVEPEISDTSNRGKVEPIWALARKLEWNADSE
jgi:hypothetical protein